MVFAALLVLALVAAAPAAAAPPRTATITGTASQNRHPMVTWLLPPGVEAFAVEIATSPSTGSDGAFFQENVRDLGLLQPTQTTYLGTSQLDPGTYYTHVETQDTSCSYLDNTTCFAWSAPAQLAISLPANHRPTLQFVRWAVYTGEAVMKVCDETEGRLTFRTILIQDFFGHGRRTRARIKRESGPTFAEGESACETYYVPLPGLYGAARYTMKMTVADARGGTSKPLVKRWVTRDY
jgi:hypothetical protein